MKSSRIAEYYGRGVQTEWTRMERHPFEFELTKRHLAPYLRPGASIADIGGGPGRYALHYAAAGHPVTLVDLTPQNVAFARGAAEQHGVTLSDAQVGDARDLSGLATAAYDVTLCMGPLYHLQNAADRAAAIGECIRITVPGGVLAFAFITPVAHAISLLARDPDGIVTAFDELSKGLAGAQIDFTTFGFTDAHYMHADDVTPYLAGFGLDVCVVAGVEALGWAIERTLKQVDPAATARWLDYCFAASTDSSLRGASQHLLAICRKPKHSAGNRAD